MNPVIDLARCAPVDRHDPPADMADQVELRDRHCVFPWCTRPARSATRTTSSPTPAGVRPAPATSPRSAGATTGTRPTAAGATSSSNPACSCGPALRLPLPRRRRRHRGRLTRPTDPVSTRSQSALLDQRAAPRDQLPRPTPRRRRGRRHAWRRHARRRVPARHPGRKGGSRSARSSTSSPRRPASRPCWMTPTSVDRVERLDPPPARRREPSGLDHHGDDHRPAPVGAVDPAADDAAYGLLELVGVVDPVGDRVVQGVDDRLLDGVEGRVVLGEAAGVDLRARWRPCR